MLYKGFEGGFLAGGSAEYVIQHVERLDGQSVDTDLHLFVVMVSVITGFILKCLKNFIKNR